MKSVASCCFVVLCVSVTVKAVAEERKPPAARRHESVESIAPSDERTLRATVDAFAEAFNARDAHALVALWTPDADYIDARGQSHKGRGKIEKEYATLFNAYPGVTITIEVKSFKVIGPTALEDGRCTISSEGRTISQGRYTVLHLKQDGKWLIAVRHDRWGEPPALPRTAPSRRAFRTRASVLDSRK